MKRRDNWAHLPFAVAILLCLSPGVDATVMHGDFPGATVDFLDVSETTNSAGDPEPLFGSPTRVGNTLDFDPMGFAASTTDTGGSDITDAQLNFMVMSKPGFQVANLTILEAGDTTLAGLDAEAVSSVTTEVFIDILEIDGAAPQGGDINIQTELVFSPSDGDYSLSDDGGGGPNFQTDWNGSVFVDFFDELNDRGIPFDLGVTKISVAFDNTLSAVSAAGASAFIAKKDTDGIIIIVNIPEPSSIVLVMFASGAVLLRRRQKLRQSAVTGRINC
jgi:hypothetical protein